MAYTPEQRAQALVVLESNGGNVLQTANQIGIDEKTIRNWVGQNSDLKSDMAIATAEILPDTREDFIDELKTVRNKVLRQLHDNIADLKAREAAVTLGILIDKTELLEGNATTRTAVVGSGETVNEAIERIKREIESRVVRGEILEVEQPGEGLSEAESITTDAEVVELVSDGGERVWQDEAGSGVVSSPSDSQ
jgi:transposase-like protein